MNRQKPGRGAAVRGVSKATLCFAFACLGSLSAQTPPPETPPETQQPTLVTMQIEEMPEMDPDAPRVEVLEVRASRNNSSPRTYYSIRLQGSLAMPEGLDSAFGPTGWCVLEALDAGGKAMRFDSPSYVDPGELQTQGATELYRRVGSTLGRVMGDRLTFDVELMNLDYLTPTLKKLKLQAYVMMAKEQRTVEAPLPSAGESLILEDAWTVSVRETASGKHELVMHAIAVDPEVWPLAVELVDGEGHLLSSGFRRGMETRGDTPLVRWQFNVGTLGGTPPPAPGTPSPSDPVPGGRPDDTPLPPEPEVSPAPPEASEAPEVSEAPDSSAEASPAPDAPAVSPTSGGGLHLRILLAKGLSVKQLNAELADVKLIDLGGQR